MSDNHKKLSRNKKNNLRQLRSINLSSPFSDSSSYRLRLSTRAKPISYSKIMYYNLQRYNVNRIQYNKIVINVLLDSRECHFFAIFKEKIIEDFQEEFLRRKYNLEESKERLPKFANYYKNYLNFFCKPTFSKPFFNAVIQSYGEAKAEMYYNANYSKKNKKKKNVEPKIKTIFSSTIKDDIDNNSFITNASYIPSTLRSELNQTGIKEQDIINNIINNKNLPNNNNNDTEETLLLPNNSHFVNENKISLENSMVSFINNVIKKTQPKEEGSSNIRNITKKSYICTNYMRMADDQKKQRNLTNISKSKSRNMNSNSSSNYISTSTNAIKGTKNVKFNKKTTYVKTTLKKSNAFELNGYLTSGFLTSNLNKNILYNNQNTNRIPSAGKTNSNYINTNNTNNNNNNNNNNNYNSPNSNNNNGNLGTLASYRVTSSTQRGTKPVKPENMFSNQKILAYMNSHGVGNDGNVIMNNCFTPDKNSNSTKYKNLKGSSTTNHIITIQTSPRLNTYAVNSQKLKSNISPFTTRNKSGDLFTMSNKLIQSTTLTNKLMNENKKKIRLNINVPSENLKKSPNLGNDFSINQVKTSSPVAIHVYNSSLSEKSFPLTAFQAKKTQQKMSKSSQKVPTSGKINKENLDKLMKLTLKLCQNQNVARSRSNSHRGCKPSMSPTINNFNININNNFCFGPNNMGNLGNLNNNNNLNPSRKDSTNVNSNTNTYTNTNNNLEPNQIDQKPKNNKKLNLQYNYLEFSKNLSRNKPMLKTSTEFHSHRGAKSLINGTGSTTSGGTKLLNNFILSVNNMNEQKKIERYDKVINIINSNNNNREIKKVHIRKPSNQSNGQFQEKINNILTSQKISIRFKDNNSNSNNNNNNNNKNINVNQLLLNKDKFTFNYVKSARVNPYNKK